MESPQIEWNTNISSDLKISLNLTISWDFGQWDFEGDSIVLWDLISWCCSLVLKYFRTQCFWKLELAYLPERLVWQFYLFSANSWEQYMVLVEQFHSSAINSSEIRIELHPMDGWNILDQAEQNCVLEIFHCGLGFPLLFQLHLCCFSTPGIFLWSRVMN